MPNTKVSLSPPPSAIDNGMPYQWTHWFEKVFQRVGEGPFLIRGYSVSALPSANTWFSSDPSNAFSSIILVTDDQDGPTLAFSNGSNWLRVQDNAIVS